jgi:tripartite-type tricarboxylate transporter receptor subunit TctC
MPAELRARIAADVKEVMEGDAIIKDRLTRTGQMFAPGGPAEFAASIAHQRATVKSAADALGIKERK